MNGEGESAGPLSSFIIHHSSFIIFRPAQPVVIAHNTSSGGRRGPVAASRKPADRRNVEPAIPLGNAAVSRLVAASRKPADRAGTGKPAIPLGRAAGVVP